MEKQGVTEKDLMREDIKKDSKYVTTDNSDYCGQHPAVQILHLHESIHTHIYIMSLYLPGKYVRSKNTRGKLN